MNLAIRASEYDHTQRAPLGWLLLAIALGFTATAVFTSHLWVGLIHGGVALLVLAFAPCFWHLTVRDEGEGLAIRYGPLQIFKRSIPFTDIESVRRARSRFIDGWGIHWIPFRGWTYNLWGFDCAELTVKGKTVRIGSDDADGLVEFLEQKLESQGARGPANPT